MYYIIKEIIIFNPSQSDVRNFFFDIIEKSQLGTPLTDLEKIAYSVILEHPEYKSVLNNRTKYIDYQWPIENGETNPFLHLSMHMTILEQLSIDQPIGIKGLYNELCSHFKDQRHLASHELMDCLGEMLWQAQSNRIAPDMQIYFNCINQKLGKN